MVDSSSRAAPRERRCAFTFRKRSSLPEARPGVVRYLVLPDHAGTRLDQGAAALTGVSRRRARALGEEGRIWLNGKSIRVLSRELALGDVVDVIEGDETFAAPAPAPCGVPILFEDGWLVAIDKAAGTHTQPPRERAPGELTAHELAILQLAARDGQRNDLLLFHRLDRITTGILVFARHRDAARALTRAWASPKLDKRYLAVVRGDPGERPFVVEKPLAPDALTPGKQRASRQGKPARTEVHRLTAAGGLALVEARPRTGRTHQVRVHLVDAGFPVAGDTLYSGGHGAPRPFLHAWRLTVPHPKDGKLLRLEAPIPADMAAFLASHGLGTPADD